jgi:ribosomal 50S subunit-associated protein YjgA (DUF615 family)
VFLLEARQWEATGMAFRPTDSDRVDRVLAAIRELSEQERALLFKTLETWPPALCGECYVLPQKITESFAKIIELFPGMGRALLRDIQSKAAKAKRRNRKSAPDTIHQEAEIHRLRTEDPKKWSWKVLGKRFGMSKSGAQNAFKRHVKRTGGTPTS